MRRVFGLIAPLAIVTPAYATICLNVEQAQAASDACSSPSHTG